MTTARCLETTYAADAVGGMTAWGPLVKGAHTASSLCMEATCAAPAVGGMTAWGPLAKGARTATE